MLDLKNRLTLSRRNLLKNIAHHEKSIQISGVGLHDFWTHQTYQLEEKYFAAKNVFLLSCAKFVEHIEMYLLHKFNCTGFYYDLFDHRRLQYVDTF